MSTARPSIPAVLLAAVQALLPGPGTAGPAAAAAASAAPVTAPPTRDVVLTAGRTA